MESGDQSALKAWLGRARLLLVDNEPANLAFLRHVLAPEGYGELIIEPDPQEAVARFQELDPDLVITDLVMPQMDGVALMQQFRAQLPAGAYLPILVATADHTADTRRRVLAAGARDFLTKPLSPAEVRLRVRNLLETRFLHEQLRDHNQLLETRVSERTQELEEARTEVLLRLARAAEFRDDQTGQHTVRVGRIAASVARVLGLSPAACELIGRAAPLHDVGKIGIPDAVLLKPDRLDDAERDIMQTHTLIGANILSGSGSPLLQLAEEIALSHHERWDGSGYPRQLGGESIPLVGRIVAIADVFDSLTNERPYKRAWTVRETLTELEVQAGRQFDPQVVEAMLRVVPEVQLAAGHATAGRPAIHPPPAQVPPAGAQAIELAALGARLQALTTERDELAREVQHLRRRLARRDGEVVPLQASA